MILYVNITNFNYLYEFLKKILKFYSEIKIQRQKCTNNKGNTHMIWNKTKKSKSE